MALTRSEGAGIAVAIAAHVVVFGVLSLRFFQPPPEPIHQDPIEVSLSDDTGLHSAAPEINADPPAAKLSPVEAPEEAAPPETPPQPDPAPKQEPKPQPKPQPQPDAKPVKQTPPAQASASKATRQPPRDVKASGRLDGLVNGLTAQPSKGKSDKPQASMTGEAKQNIGSAIARQVQPCADRQVSPGPGAELIKVKVRLSLNRDGSLSGQPTIVDHVGTNEDNERYVRRVDDAVRAIFAGCSPLRGLPDELYDVPDGWKSFTFFYRLRPR